MGYRKFRSDHLFTGREMLDNRHVLITDGERQVETITELENAGEGIEYLPGMISPGFINCHCHLELSHMKDMIPKHTGMIDFLISVISQRFSDEKVIQDAMAKADEEMYSRGIVAIGDICNTSHSIAAKEQSNLHYHNFIEVIGFDENLATDRFRESKQLFDEFGYLEDEKNYKRSIVPHAPYSVNEKLLKLINEFEGNEIITMHNQESEEENALFLSGSGEMHRLFNTLKIDISNYRHPGLTSLQAVHRNFNRSRKLLLVHNVHTTTDDIGSLNGTRENIFWCLCPNANLYITETLPDVDMFIKNKCTIVLGTDSLASNDQLSILEELKTIQENFPHIPTEILLQWATANGAKALKISDRFGSFDKGKSPGVVHISGIDGDRLTTNSTSVRII